jgi:hypothetical protein
MLSPAPFVSSSSSSSSSTSGSGSIPVRAPTEFGGATSTAAAFSANTRLGADQVALDLDAVTNLQYQAHTLTRVAAEPFRGAPVVHGLANSSGGKSGPGLDARSVQLESQLKWGTGAAREPGTKLLAPAVNPRPYLTVPYMGRGSVNVAQDDAVRRGEHVFDADGNMQPTQLFLREPMKKPVASRVDTYHDPRSVPSTVARANAPVNTMRGGDNSRAEYATRSS